MAITHKGEQYRVRPKDAATLIIIDNGPDVPHVLMGRRSKKLQFMPGKYVFPGGRLEVGDIRLKTATSIQKADQKHLLKKAPLHMHIERAKGLALAAIRETYEETGILVGRTKEPEPPTRSKSWKDFLNQGVVPTPSLVRYCARAITPTKNIKRFDTRFFYVDAKYIAKDTGFQSGELEDMRWVKIDSTDSLDIPNITKLILDDIYNGYLERTLFTNNFKIPFYYTKNGTFIRDIVNE